MTITYADGITYLKNKTEQNKNRTVKNLCTQNDKYAHNEKNTITKTLTLCYN